MFRFLCSSTILVIALVSLLGGVEAFVTSPVAKTRAAASLAAFRFGGGGAKKSSAKMSPFAEEALASYPLKFRPEDEAKDAPGRPKICTTKSQALKTFNEMARLYGDERALKMVKILPQTLTFNSANFEACLNSWTEQFELEPAQKMVERNPGLLGVDPSLAAEPAEASMALSYLVFITRPSPLKVLIFSAFLLYVFTPK